MPYNAETGETSFSERVWNKKEGTAAALKVWDNNYYQVEYLKHWLLQSAQNISFIK